MPGVLLCSEMAVTVVLVVSLAAVLRQAAGQQPDLSSLLTENADVQKEITEKHNGLRRSVQPSASNMLKMEWSPAAAENAKRWAQECTFSHSKPDQRTIGGRRCGENLFMSTGLTSWSQGIQAWYDEVKDFTYGRGSTGVTGHYTQVVWYRSYLLGCSFARCSWGYYFVCHYCPAGNMRNSINTPYKAGRPCADCPNACDNGLCTNPCKYDDDYSNCPALSSSPGCGHSDVKNWCKASCGCATEIK